MDEKIVKDSQGLAKDLVNDYISRKAAIERIDEALARVFKEPCGELILRKVPSAQPERERGRWIPNIYPDVGDGYRCSQCGAYHVVPYKFCHNCGADMREVDDE